MTPSTSDVVSKDSEYVLESSEVKTFSPVSMVPTESTKVTVEVPERNVPLMPSKPEFPLITIVV